MEEKRSGGLIDADALKGDSQGLEELARSGDLSAIRTLGERYEQGDGVEADLTLALTWYGDGDRRGDPVCAFRAGRILERQGSAEKAKAFYRRAIQGGCQEAETALSALTALEKLGLLKKPADDSRGAQCASASAPAPAAPAGAATVPPPAPPKAELPKASGPKTIDGLESDPKTREARGRTMVQMTTVLSIILAIVGFYHTSDYFPFGVPLLQGLVRGIRHFFQTNLIVSGLILVIYWFISFMVMTYPVTFLLNRGMRFPLVGKPLLSWLLLLAALAAGWVLDMILRLMGVTVFGFLILGYPVGQLLLILLEFILLGVAAKLFFGKDPAGEDRR